MNYYLIGMPGSGKSTVGKELAKSLSLSFVDLDSYIEEQEKCLIKDIFESKGEAYFRNLESKALESFKNKDNYVVSCGGGIILDRNNKKLMNGFIIFLNPPLEDIAIRLQNDGGVRPLLKVKTPKELFEERKANYEYFMDFEIKETILSHVVKEIIRRSKEYGKKDSTSN